MAGGRGSRGLGHPAAATAPSASRGLETSGKANAGRGSKAQRVTGVRGRAGVEREGIVSLNAVFPFRAAESA